MQKLPLCLIRPRVGNIWQYFIQKALQAVSLTIEKGVVGKNRAFPPFLEVLQHGEVLSGEPALIFKKEGFTLLGLTLQPQVHQNLCELLLFLFTSSTFLHEVLFFHFSQH